MKERVKLHLLPTEDDGSICVRHDKPFLFIPRVNIISPVIRVTHNHFNLHATSDKEIKEGDTYINEEGRLILHRNKLLPKGRKVIATTDFKLTSFACNQDIGYCSEGCLGTCNSIKKFSQSFIEEYCKNPVEEVDLEYTAVCCKAYNFCNMKCRPNEFRPTVNSNNEVIAHLIEEKMYSKQEVEQMLFDISTELSWDDKDEDELIENCQNKIKEIKENL